MVYEWQVTSMYETKKYTYSFCIVIAHIYAITIQDESYIEADNDFPYILEISTEKRIWTRHFATYQEALNEYAIVKTLMGKYYAHL